MLWARSAMLLPVGNLYDYFAADDDAAAADPRQCALLSDPSSEDRWVVTVTETLRDALANAHTEQLAQAAVAWPTTEEFRGHGDPDLLGDVLNCFATLARTARSRGQHLYCWMSL